MDTCVFLLVPKVTSFRAVVELVSENSRIFSGESLHLRCSIPDVHRSNWSVEWFRGSERLPENGENFHLWNAHIKEAGKFSCQGARKSVVGIIRTMQSLPVEIDVDGGWAILKAPSHPPLVGDTLKLSCRLRGNPPVHETILYRDGIEVMRQSGQNLSFYLSNVTLEDAGMYSCRVSWDARRRTYSVISVNTMVNILEVLSPPSIEIYANVTVFKNNKMKLICHVQYNARAPAPPVHFYFYKNNRQLGLAKSKNSEMVATAPGQYSCRVKVPQLNLVRWSQPSNFGEMPE
ncbi:High affinity immunoglobulin epsilon receptor subunit alpha [Oryzias melastigma]|nr:High affinity immunoglobulin epsilon receptor subunit alpha [Oryzias melastigma]